MKNPPHILSFFTVFAFLENLSECQVPTSVLWAKYSEELTD
jgi:hypothetical protein